VLPHNSASLRLPALGFGFLALAIVGALLVHPVTPERARLTAASAGQHAFRTVTTTSGFRNGASQGFQVKAGSLTISKPVGHLKYAGRTWAYSRWTSSWIKPRQSFTQLIPSWNITTPSGTAVKVSARVRSSSGRLSGFKVMGWWTTRDAGFRRTSASTQRDSVAWANVDTLTASKGVSLTGYQLRVTAIRRPSSTPTPTVRSLQAVASRPVTALPATSRRLLHSRTLAVPRYSQMVHGGQYRQYGGGGEAWCSPTSLSMVLGYYGALPSASNYAWVNKAYSDPWVDHVARVVYDYGYEGAGNWAFNTAYAANLTKDAFVTRLKNLREAEKFIAAGIPLVASISFSKGQLSGAPISATAGHLVVIAGFTKTGDVVVNDPAAARNSTVRRTYDRGQFEKAWLRKSSGTVYVVRNSRHPLPARGSSKGW
jgi:Peptidase_C39 like family